MNTGSVNMVSYERSGKLELADSYQFTDPGSYELGLEGATNRQPSSRLHSSFVMPDGKHLAVCNMGSDKVYILEIDYVNRKLHLLPDLTITTDAGEAPRKLAFSKDGRFAYMSSEQGNNMYVYSIGEDCSLTLLQMLSTLDPDRENRSGGYTSVSIMTEDGKYLYCGNRGQNNVVGFAVGDDGLLSVIGYFDCYGDSPRGLSFGYNEEVVFCSNNASSTITIVAYDKSTGKLGECLQTIENVGGSANVVWGSLKDFGY